MIEPSIQALPSGGNSGPRSSGFLASGQKPAVSQFCDAETPGNLFWPFGMPVTS